ncbi:hypothetical protein DMN91_000204 [Ooceraea biroi]|uniref:Uncharacterized protein n=1 Tax=Ooceraea biroi TaxID=2015173 RepID=A0A3L8E110_OOCBI|nr:hypothetical protein DMN91_000204 [Ooceraea biroi]
MIFRVSNLISFAAFGLCRAKEQMLRLPEFNFPSLNPYTFYDHHHATYDSGILYIDVQAINISLKGFRNIRFLDAEAYFTDNIFHLDIDVQTSQIIEDRGGLAHIIGSASPFTLNSTGYFKVTVIDIKARWIIAGPVAGDRWIVERFLIPLKIKDLNIHLTGFHGSEELGKYRINFKCSVTYFLI